MAKQGSTRPWRISYEWENGVKGTETRATFGEAQAFARELERTATGSRAMHVTGAVSHRDGAFRVGDRHVEAATFTYGPASVTVPADLAERVTAGLYAAVKAAEERVEDVREEPGYHGPQAATEADAALAEAQATLAAFKQLRGE